MRENSGQRHIVYLPFSLEMPTVQPLALGHLASCPRLTAVYQWQNLKFAGAKECPYT